jgi:hypothetical protein
MVWPVKTHPAHSTGLECKRISSAGEGCSLDFPFYRTDISARGPSGPNFRIADKPGVKEREARLESKRY